MQVGRCDVMGCGGIAYWVRVAPSEKYSERYLCQRCWAKLRASSSEQALNYAPNDDPEGAAFAFSSGTLLELPNVRAESNVIG